REVGGILGIIIAQTIPEMIMVKYKIGKTWTTSSVLAITRQKGRDTVEKLVAIATASLPELNPLRYCSLVNTTPTFTLPTLEANKLIAERLGNVTNGLILLV